MVGKSGTAASVCHPPSPAAAQTIGAEVVARAEPDGHTLLVTPPAPLVLEQWLDPKWASQALALEPVTVLATFPQVLVVNPKVPAQTFAEWIAHATANPGPMSYGSPGAGSTAQLAQQELFRTLGLDLVHLPYRGMAPAMNDVMAAGRDQVTPPAVLWRLAPLGPSAKLAIAGRGSRTAGVQPRERSS
jgi:tripartite-type tricarboxylate transporter receptor subunit TctC